MFPFYPHKSHMFKSARQPYKQCIWEMSQGYCSFVTLHQNGLINYTIDPQQKPAIKSRHMDVNTQGSIQ